MDNVCTLRSNNVERLGNLLSFVLDIKSIFLVLNAFVCMCE